MDKAWQKLGKHSGKESIGNEKAHIGDNWAITDEAKRYKARIARHRRAKGWQNMPHRERQVLVSTVNGIELFW